MWTKDFNNTANIILKLLAQFLILLCVFIYLDYVYLTNIRPDLYARETFVQTECLVMSKKLSSKGKILRRYRADFLVNYHANGVQYNRWVSGNGLDMTHTRNNTSQEQILSDYENGTNYTCWYNPKNPEKVMLVQRTSWLSFYTFILPAIFAVIIAVFFIRNGLRLAGLIKDKKSKNE